nr:hypothetical protein CFP56_72598 [Quercus suber]
MPADHRGVCPIDEKGYLSTSTDSSSLFSIDTKYFSARTANVIKQDENLASQYKQREQGNGNVLHENVESHPGNSDEEVVGIITMKDVMEELLQELLHAVEI